MRDKYNLIPPVIKENYAKEEMIDRHISSATRLYHEAQALDPRLDVVFFTDRADPTRGVVPGRWHFVRHNEMPAADSYIPITMPDGGYKEPGPSDLNALKERDLWTHGIPEKKQEKPDTLRREQEIDEIVHDVKAAYRVPGEGGMTKRLRGRK